MPATHKPILPAILTRYREGPSVSSRVVAPQASNRKANAAYEKAQANIP